MLDTKWQMANAQQQLFSTRVRTTEYACRDWRVFLFAEDTMYSCIVIADCQWYCFSLIEGLGSANAYRPHGVLEQGYRIVRGTVIESHTINNNNMCYTVPLQMS